MQDLSDAYANAAHIPDGDSYPDRWAHAAAAFRATARMQTHAYGTGAREGFDLFLPEGTAEGVLIFVHGGYWLAFDRSDWSHLAAGPLARGWVVAMPSYDLCPDVRISAITRQIARAVDVIAGITDAKNIVLAGHSAGGHLAARMACADVAPAALPHVRRIVPISPLANLPPLLRTDMNADLRLDAAEAASESPVLHPRPAVPVHVWVGADERPAFRDQALWLSHAWDAPLTVAPERHHFDVVGGLMQADSPLTRAVLG